jgi:hypothetical protein
MHSSLILTTSYSLAVANHIAFHNCMISMRPKSTNHDLSSCHDVTTYIHNAFIQQLESIKADILVSNPLLDKRGSYSFYLQSAPGRISTTFDGWTADTTKGAFLGVTAHWIQVLDGIWSSRSEVIGFKGLSGRHDGRNLGGYFVGICERVGIVNANHQKVCSSFITPALKLSMQIALYRHCRQYRQL